MFNSEYTEDRRFEKLKELGQKMREAQQKYLAGRAYNKLKAEDLFEMVRLEEEFDKLLKLL